MNDAQPSLLTAVQVRLYLFGSFRLEKDNRPVHLPTAQIRSLLAYLALHPESHSREKLAALLWGDFTDVQARASLRNALAVLRKHLGTDLLLADRQTVQLNPAYPLWVDALQFQQQVAAKLDLYQDDLLIDFYDDWIGPEREYYRNLYLETLLQLAQQQQSRGEYEAAIALAQQILLPEPTHEPAHQTIMTCYLTLGHRHAALKQYEACRRLLAAELGVEPQPATIALYEQIKRAGTPAAVPLLTNLPAPLTRLIGRRREVAEIKRLLTGTAPSALESQQASPVRLLTLTGPGGCGKTRLAIQAAGELTAAYPDGVWWVELAAVVDPAFVPEAVAKSLGLRSLSDQPLIEILIKHLRPRRILLALDNCEHLIVACARLVEALLPACPQLRILATSREALGLTGETVWPAPSLSLPNSPDDEALVQSEAMQLFTERAAAARPTFAVTSQNVEAIIEICRQLDGLPLALELAAAQVKTLSVAEIARHLTNRLSLLRLGSRSAQPRHQTLRVALDWSYDLLSEDEQTLFRRLAVFAGGFTLAAVEGVMDQGKSEIKEGSTAAGQDLEGAMRAGRLLSPFILDNLAQLVNKSLIVVGHRTETTRYRLLEPVRQYGLDRLWLAGEESTMRRRHLAWFAALVEQAEPELLGADQIIWLDRLEQDYANLSMALRFAAEGEAADIEVGLRLGGALWRFWDLRGYIAEGWERLIRLLALSSDAAAEARARAIFSAGMLALYRMDSQTAVALLEESLALWQKLGQQHGLALALQHLGFIAHRLGQPALARARYEEGLAVWRQLNEPWGLAETLGMLGNLAYWEGAYDKARMLQTESLQLKRQLNEKRGIAFSVWSLGKVAQAQGDYAEAYALYEEALITMHQLQDRGGLPFVLEALGYLAAAKGQAERAVRLLGAADSLRQAVGSMLPHISRADHDRYIADIRQQLSEVTFAAAWDAGQVMDLEQAVEYALQAG